MTQLLRSDDGGLYIGEGAPVYHHGNPLETVSIWEFPAMVPGR